MLQMYSQRRSSDNLVAANIGYPENPDAHVHSQISCILQVLVASIEGTMHESQEGMKGMQRYKAQLYRSWPKEDIQTWVMAFNKCMQQTQAAHDAALDAAKNKGQVTISQSVG